MIKCLTVAFMELFVGALSPEIVTRSTTGFIIHAETGDVEWAWEPEDGLFCIQSEEALDPPDIVSDD